MIPILYDKTGNVKIGELTNCIECLVEEERNGLFEVSLIYPTNDTLFNSLEEENIIVCNANDTLLNQKFRIYMTRKLMSNKIEVFARHISFDLAYDHINTIEIENQSCEYTLNTIFRNSQFSTHYKGYSDIINAQDYKISKVNCIEAIGGKEGSILDTFGTGAEILRDNTNIHVLNKRGYDNGVSIEYAKNLTGFELEEDYSELITRIVPFATYTDSETSEEILVEAGPVDSDLISNYSHPYISYMDFSEKFGEEETPTIEKLTNLAKKYFKNNNCDKPKQNFKIEFIPLSKCVGYEGIEDNISLCDTVTIKDARYNINTKAKVIKTIFNALKNRYESMELGEPRTTLGDIINSSGGSGESGEQGPPGPQGPPGQDGNIGDFPNSLPSTPVLNANVYGFASIELNWTYENKVYYNYELYGSKTKNFTPNTFNLIHAGQTSSFLFQAKPNETWYFRVCAVNTHGERTTFSSQITVNTTKIDDLSNYVDNMAIKEALIGTLSLDRGWVGTLKGNYIDAKQLSVTDGNGKRTLDIDSYGNVNLDVTSLKISSKSVATNESVNSQISSVNTSINKINSNITNIDNDVSNVESNLNSLTSKVNTVEQKITSNAIVSTVTSSTTWKTQTNNITTAQNTANTANSTANANKNNLSNLTSRVSTAEQKITSDAIVSTVTSSSTYKNDLTGKVSTNKVVSSINQTAESVKIKANKIQLEGAVTVANKNGDSIKINNGDYEIRSDSTVKGFLGLRDLDDNYTVPRLALGQDGLLRSSNNYFVIQAYPKNNNPQNYGYPYVDIAYRLQKYKTSENVGDVSNIKIYGDGVTRLSPVKTLEITTNFKNGSYNGEGESLIAEFGSSSSSYYDKYMDIPTIRNTQTTNGLILAHRNANDQSCFVRVNCDSNGDRFFRPLTTDGNISLGSGNYQWKSVHSKTTYSSAGVIANDIEVIPVNNKDILDNINFISPLNDEEELIIDVTNIKNTNYVDSYENNVYLNNNEIIKLLLKEVKQLKEELNKLKGGA